MTRAHPAREVLAVGAVVLSAFLLLSWPFPLHPASTWVGGSYNDHPSLAWTFDWVARRLRACQAPWGHTDRMEWPRGSFLLPADLPEAVLLSPLTLLTGAVATIGLLALLHHALAAALTWGWLRREGADGAGAATGSIAWSWRRGTATPT